MAPIPDHDLEFSFFKSSGPGGQKKNKTESAVRLRHLPTGIEVIATQSRSQHRNRAMALEELERRLWALLAESAGEDVPLTEEQADE